jgi:hypothetical protein
MLVPPSGAKASEMGGKGWRRKKGEKESWRDKKGARRAKNLLGSKRRAGVWSNVKKWTSPFQYIGPGLMDQRLQIRCNQCFINFLYGTPRKITMASL